MPDVVVVTGAASGIGLATAERLVRDGGVVVALDVAEDGLEAAAARIGTSFQPVAGDVATRAAHEQAASAALEQGRLVGWVNVAGIWIPTRAHDFDDEAFERVLRVNLVGTALGCSVACRTWLEQGIAGAIVNVSSIESTEAFPSALAYEASKGAVDAMTRQVAVDYGPAGIRCNAVRPGAIITPMAEQYLGDYDDREAMIESWREFARLRRTS
jgi:NAD(P)-dependent dehydrogenase (short-subunit alcohol dehydrogenase family)